nr:unnamed protein product [Callosobruchus analis]
MGNGQRENFIRLCAEDKRFEKHIKKENNMQKKKMSVSGKVLELRMQHKILTPVPLSTCHIDGSICKTNKTALLKVLEQQIEPQLRSIQT